MYESLMEEVVREDNRDRALAAVKRNQGAPGVDQMRTTELESHLQAHWERVRAKLLAGTWVPSPVKRVEIPKPSGGTRMLGIPTVMDRLIQQMLLQALTPIFDPAFSEHSYGFRPGRSAQDAMRAAQQYAQEGQDWVVDLARISHQGLPPAGRDRMGPVLRVSGGLVALCRGVGRVCGVRKWNSVLRIRFSEDRKTHFPYFVCFQLRFCRFLSFIRFWLSGAEPHFRGC